MFPSFRPSMSGSGMYQGMPMMPGTGMGQGMPMMPGMGMDMGQSMMPGAGMGMGMGQPMMPGAGMGTGPIPGTAAPLPSEQSYIENILRLNLGKTGTFYMTYENNSQWNAKIFKGVLEAAGRDHIIISDPATGMRILLLMVNLDYATFDQPLTYIYPGVIGNPPAAQTGTSPTGTAPTGVTNQALKKR